MFPAFDNRATTARPIASSFRRFTIRITAALRAARAPLRKLDLSHAARCHHAAFAAEEARDTGMDASDATGIESWQPDLPFFMQSGFGRK